MARALLAIGAGKGARISLLAPDGILWITTLLAGARIGALTSMISTLCAPRELAHILRNSDTQILIAARRFLRHDYAETLETALPGLATTISSPAPMRPTRPMPRCSPRSNGRSSRATTR